MQPFYATKLFFKQCTGKLQNNFYNVEYYS